MRNTLNVEQSKYKVHYSGGDIWVTYIWVWFWGRRSHLVAAADCCRRGHDPVGIHTHTGCLYTGSLFSSGHTKQKLSYRHIISSKVPFVYSWIQNHLLLTLNPLIIFPICISVHCVPPRYVLIYLSKPITFVSSCMC